MSQRGFIDFQDIPAIRMQGAERTVRLQISGARYSGKETLFTLHSASGFRRADGTVTLEKIAGYCHERRMLRTLWLHRVVAITDIATGEPITDIADWLKANEIVTALPYEPEAPHYLSPPANEDLAPLDESAAPANAAEAIDEAARFAWEAGDQEIGERLFRIGGLLAASRRSRHTLRS